MSHEEEWRQAEEVAIGIARSLDENEYEQVQNLYEAIEADPDGSGLSQEQVNALDQISGLAQRKFVFDSRLSHTFLEMDP